jgi:hypothetical protein
MSKKLIRRINDQCGIFVQTVHHKCGIIPQLTIEAYNENQELSPVEPGSGAYLQAVALIITEWSVFLQHTGEIPKPVMFGPVGIEVRQKEKGFSLN